MNAIFAVITMLLLSGCTTQSTGLSQEPIPSRDYQRCLDAEKMGASEGIEARCGKLQQEIE